MKLFNKRIFLDYAATTPVDRRVFSAMKKYFRREFANPLSFYKEGITANIAIENARRTVAKIAGVRENEVIFTSSGTESDNLAISGVLAGIRKDSSNLFSSFKQIVPEVVTTVIEHPAILETCREIQNQGVAAVTFIPVLENGLIDTSKIQNVLNEKTVVVSVIMVNNEIGTIQSLRDVSREIKKFKNKIGRRHDEAPFLHTDASQAPCFLDINLDRLGVDMMTLDASKIYGPKGIGCLIKKSYVPMSSIQFGGNQEFGIRPATHNVPSIVGLAKALEIASDNKDKNFINVQNIQKYFIEKIEKEIPQAKINGSIKNRIPNNINICIEGLNSEFAVIQLDEMGVSCSAMTSCKSTSENAKSYVVEALGHGCGASSLRFTLGLCTKKREIKKVILKIKKVIELQKVGK